jgi:hypothetical protein
MVENSSNVTLLTIGPNNERSLVGSTFSRTTAPLIAALAFSVNPSFVSGAPKVEVKTHFCKPIAVCDPWAGIGPEEQAEWDVLNSQPLSRDLMDRLVSRSNPSADVLNEKADF